LFEICCACDCAATRCDGLTSRGPSSVQADIYVIVKQSGDNLPKRIDESLGQLVPYEVGPLNMRKGRSHAAAAKTDPAPPALEAGGVPITPISSP
jgi:hypothetical protein